MWVAVLLVSCNWLATEFLSTIKVRVLCFAPAIFMEYEYHYRYVFSVASDKLYWSFLASIFSMDKPGNLQLRALSN